jgi:hypothetical protein
VTSAAADASFAGGTVQLLGTVTVTLLMFLTVWSLQVAVYDAAADLPADGAAMVCLNVIEPFELPVFAGIFVPFGITELVLFDTVAMLSQSLLSVQVTVAEPSTALQETLPAKNASCALALCAAIRPAPVSSAVTPIVANSFLNFIPCSPRAKEAQPFVGW